MGSIENSENEQLFELVLQQLVLCLFFTHVANKRLLSDPDRRPFLIHLDSLAKVPSWSNISLVQSIQTSCLELSRSLLNGSDQS